MKRRLEGSVLLIYGERRMLSCCLQHRARRSLVVYIERVPLPSAFFKAPYPGRGERKAAVLFLYEHFRINKVIRLVGDCARLELINGKDLMSQNKQETIDKAVAGGWAYTNRLIGVALAAGRVVAGAKGDGRYHCRVSKQRYNMLRRALEALRKQQ